MTESRTAERVATLGLLDGFRLDVEADGPVVGLSRGAQRLLAHLSLTGRPTRSAVAGTLWPDVGEEQASSSLRSSLWRLHRAAPGLVTSSAEGLSLAGGVRVDVHELVSWARSVLDPRGPVHHETPEVALRGELLPGWYEDWVLLERERLRQLRMHALEALSDKLCRAGRYGEALQAAHAVLAAEPLRETAHRAAIRVHVEEGNLAEALRAHECFRRLLQAELGVAPTPRLDDPLRGLVPAELLRDDRPHQRPGPLTPSGHRPVPPPR